jgi:16S rRNA (cytosine967-C5)-methyltransferase
MFELRSHPPLATLPSFQQGLFYVQDPSTLLAVCELAPRPGERVLDLCAAPGGKTTFIAQLMQNQGPVVAEDNDPARLARVQENCLRLGVSCVQVQRPDTGSGIEVPTKGEGQAGAAQKFDRVLLDAPCSNTGVMRRRVELRWRIQPAEIERLRGVQLRLLRRAVSRLRPGGTLVYSTCSLEPEENQQVVQEFCRETAGVQCVAERVLTPVQDHVDGAYVARLITQDTNPG